MPFDVHKGSTSTRQPTQKPPIHEYLNKSLFRICVRQTAVEPSAIAAHRINFFNLTASFHVWQRPAQICVANIHISGRAFVSRQTGQMSGASFIFFFIFFPCVCLLCVEVSSSIHWNCGLSAPIKSLARLKGSWLNSRGVPGLLWDLCPFFYRGDFYWFYYLWLIFDLVINDFNLINVLVC